MQIITLLALCSPSLVALAVVRRVVLPPEGPVRLMNRQLQNTVRSVFNRRVAKLQQQ
jgi:hypothetical protein